MAALLDVQQEMRAASRDLQDRIRVESTRRTLDPIIAARQDKLARLRQEGEQLEKDRPLDFSETPVAQDSLVLRQQSPSIVRRAQIGLTTFLAALAALAFAQWRFARVNG